jgi:predicted RNA methylase
MAQMIQMELFDFFAQQEAVEIVREKPQAPVTAPVKEIVVLPPEPRNFLSDGKTVMPGAKAERIEANLNAVRLVKAGRELDYVEKMALSRFSGWGGLTEVFLPENRHYSGLKELLNEEEYRTAQNSILDSFYTPESLIDFMWDIARNDLNVKTGRVAELGAGTGNFIGLAPMQSGYRFTAVEVDKISGGILRVLYPEADVRIASLEKVKLGCDFDLVIGNVPFGQTGLHDRQYPNWNLHNYFIARALDCLKDGGHAVLLTSSATLDSNYADARKVFAQKAGLVKAYRLPKNSFAGTEIVADILVFQKDATAHPFVNLKLVPTGDDTGEMLINEYFAGHPENVRGILSNTGKMYGKIGTPTVLPNG